MERKVYTLGLSRSGNPYRGLWSYWYAKEFIAGEEGNPPRQSWRFLQYVLFYLVSLVMTILITLFIPLGYLIGLPLLFLVEGRSWIAHQFQRPRKRS